jgi:uncharacterized protein YkwD
MTRVLTRLRSGLLLASAASMALALNAAPQASAQMPQINLPGFTIGLAGPAPAGAPAIDPASAQYRSQLEGATNAARQRLGLAPLRINGDLTRVATGWSGTQAAQNRMFHNPDVGGQIPGGWSHYSENVLQNYQHATPQQLVDQWLASPGHAVNLLRPDHTDLGVGVAVAGDGKLYATQVFARY